MKVSIIIPTLNEEENIGTLLQSLIHLEGDPEIIVVDGHSIDHTVAVSRRYVRVLFSPRGRGTQMNTGALAASGDVLWFLHADCHPHPASISAIVEALQNPDVVGGGFEYNLNHPGWFFRLAEILSNRKNRLFGLLFGDMGIFVREEIFRLLDGFKEIPIMEDMDFCRKLKKQGKIVILPQRMNTSARRWLQEGRLKNMIRNWILQIAWLLGASPAFLARFYQFSGEKIHTHGRKSVSK